MEFILLLLLIVAIVISIWSIKSYNKLQSSKQSIVEQASNINVSLQKRRDLASRIIDIAQGFGDHEKLTHMQVSSNSSSENLSALSQSYPQLKANETYLKLMSQLEDLENTISDRRVSYNRSVNRYNSFRSNFPTMLVASKLNFEAAPYYEADNEESLQQLAVFLRDDSQAVKELINASGSKLKKTAHSLSNNTKKHLTDMKNSETVQSVWSKGEDIINESKNKFSEATNKESETNKLNESSSDTTNPDPLENKKTD